MTIEDMRADLANALRIQPDEIADDDNLYDLGLDSMRVMDLAMKWEAAGLKLDIGTLYEKATLRDWWQTAETG